MAQNDQKHICLNVLRNIPSLLVCVIMDGDCSSFQTSKTVLLCLLHCSSSYFTVDGLHFMMGLFSLRVWLSLFSLQQKSRRDVGNFDKEFTKMAVELTPTDKLFIMNLDQNEFQGFSYTNPEFIIQVWGVPQRRSPTDSSSIPSHAPVLSQASSEPKLDNIYMQILTLCGFRCWFLSGTSG